MSNKSLAVTVAVLVVACFAGTGAADVVCPSTSYCDIAVTDKDRITISPDGNGETWADKGITINVYLKNCNGDDLVGVPRENIIIFNNGLCICPGGNLADADSDVNGCASFSGTMQAGGCANSLEIFADGVLVCTTGLGGLPVVGTNSPDIGAGTNCSIDSQDFANFGPTFGPGGTYDVCTDLNESGGPTIDSADFALFGSFFGATCP